MPHRQLIRTQILGTVFIITINLYGAIQAILFAAFVIPGPPLLSRDHPLLNFVVAPAYVVFALVVGLAWGTVVFRRSFQWWSAGRMPSRSEQVATLRLPWRLTLITAALRFGADALFTAAALIVLPDSFPMITMLVTFNGLGMCALTYLLGEFVIRPAAAKAFEPAEVEQVEVPYASRRFAAWAVGSALPVAGIIVVAIDTYFEPVTTRALAFAVIVFGAMALISGSVLTLIGVRAARDPVKSVAEGMAKIAKGDLNARVVVYDGTDLGALQTGFNRMAAGLQEREVIQELFGRHVGHDVVVDEVDKHNGFINKFEGDAALAIFGAPADLYDPAGQALAAARAIARRLPVEVPECTAAIGVSFGAAVTGNIGARDRFEYTVIGDSINEAARWKLGDEVTLRGRSEPTRLAAPAA